MTTPLPYTAESLLEHAVKTTKVNADRLSLRVAKLKNGNHLVFIDGRQLEMSFHTKIEAMTWCSMFLCKMVEKQIGMSR